MGTNFCNNRFCFLCVCVHNYSNTDSNNNTDQAQDVNVKIEVKGATLKADAALKGSIPAKGQARFEWPVEVQDVNAVGVTFQSPARMSSPGSVSAYSAISRWKRCLNAWRSPSTRPNA